MLSTWRREMKVTRWLWAAPPLGQECKQTDWGEGNVLRGTEWAQPSGGWGDRREGPLLEEPVGELRSEGGWGQVVDPRLKEECSQESHGQDAVGVGCGKRRSWRRGQGTWSQGASAVRGRSHWSCSQSGGFREEVSGCFWHLLGLLEQDSKCRLFLVFFFFFNCTAVRRVWRMRREEWEAGMGHLNYSLKRMCFPSWLGAVVSENCPSESAPGCAHNSSPRGLAVKADELLLHSCAGSPGRMDQACDHTTMEEGFEG